ncbi:MAG TPA: FG-GAP-like repeat-containing protein [Terracidiphilus sp.]
MAPLFSAKGLAATFLSASLVVLTASAQGRFAQAPVYALGGTIFSAITTDVNHDGRTDMVALVSPVTGGTSAAITVTMATSTGAYTSPTVISMLPANTTGYVGAGDFNHDGNVDLAAALSTGKLEVFLGNGDGTFQAPRTISFSGTVVGLLAGKFVGSANSDIALMMGPNSFSSSAVELFASNGNGTFAAPKVTNVNFVPFASVLGDVNKDGKLDLVLCDRSVSYQTLLGRGDGTFQALPSQNLAGTGGFGALAIADYNGDGKPDLILANEGDWTHYSSGEIPSLLVLTGFGDGTFNNTGIVDDSGNSGWGLTQGDFNGDGKADLVVYNGLSSTVAMKLMSPGGRLVFPEIASYAVAGDIQRFVALLNGDANGDGKRDLLVVMQNGVQVLEGVSGGYLSAPNAGEVATFSLDLKSSNFDPAAGTPSDLMIRGLDVSVHGDLQTETLYTALGSSAAPLLRNVTGHFTDESGAPLGPLGIGDFDHNSAEDLLIAQGVFLNSGNSSFTGPGPAVANIGNSLHTMADRDTVVGDLNKDGFADLVTVGQTELTVTLGKGDGTFKPAVNYSLGGTDGNAVVVRDINGDGKLDAITANYGSSSVSIFLGKGDGTFQAAKEYTVTSHPVDIAIGDFNGDGKLDIAAASATKITILLNNGAGGFTTGTTFTAGTSVEGIGAASLRGNGLADLMVVDSTERSLRLFYNSGGAKFGSAVVFPLGDMPTSLVVSDINGDGAMDVAVAMSNSSAIPLFLNHGGTGLEESMGPLSASSFAISLKVTAGVKGDPTPTGTVTFRDGTKVLATAALSGGTAKITATLSKGTHVIAAAYNGSSFFNPHSGISVSWTVQ